MSHVQAGTVHFTVSLINASTCNYAADKQYQRFKTLANRIWTHKPFKSERFTLTPSNERINPEQAFPRRLKDRKCNIPKQTYPVLPLHLIRAMLSSRLLRSVHLLTNQLRIFLCVMIRIHPGHSNPER